MIEGFDDFDPRELPPIRIEQGGMTMADYLPNVAGSLGPSREPNCGVTAIAIAAGLPFPVVFEGMRKACGKSKRWRGITHEQDRVTGLDLFKVRHLPLYVRQFRRERRLSLATWLRRLKPGLYLVCITGHVISLTIRPDGSALMVDQHSPNDWHPVRPEHLRVRVNSVRLIEGRDP